MREWEFVLHSDMQMSFYTYLETKKRKKTHVRFFFAELFSEFILPKNTLKLHFQSSKP